MNNMNKSDLDLVKLLKKFDPDTKSFKFGTKSFQITTNAVNNILGLPNEGKSVKLGNDRKRITKVKAIKMHFGQGTLEKSQNHQNPWVFSKPLKNEKTLREKGDPVDKGTLKTYKKQKTTREEGDLVDKKKENKDDKGGQGEAEEVAEQGKPDDDDQTPELKEIRKKKRFEIAARKEPVAIQDLLVQSMTAEINYRQHQDPSFVCPKRLKLWKDEINKDSEKKMMEFWNIFIQAEKRSNELEEELATHKEKLHDEECVAATMIVESTIQLHEIQNLKKRITKLEGKEPHIEP
ncbi:hypothetical protein L3X38_001748 [Prunus dulcis]|uniref:Uncharacterized protein n=1 Tax=Prunus dulcis TaxID=3755 RepID=A0AAD4ZKI6_PRUDU|nr:hypothetical protein L3X38_001748 [Prunus dulcis]